MKSLKFAVILLAFTAVTSATRAQSSDASPGIRSREVIGEVERAGAQLQAVLTNPSDARAFQGSAKISVGLSAESAIQLTVNLAPGETRSFPLSISNPSEKQYSLAVYNQTGKLVLFKIAPITANIGIVREAAPAPIPAPAPGKTPGNLKITTRLTRGAASQDDENPSSNPDEHFLLTFEIESETPVMDANFILSAGDFQNRQQFSLEGRAVLEFKLPETLSERKLNYLITSSGGQTLASGMVDLDQLAASDSVSVNASTFGHPAYAPVIRRAPSSNF